MDTQAGAQSATNSQTTIDLQAGIIASHQDEIGRANVRITDQSAEIDRLKIVVADRNAKVAELMGEAARAEIDADEITLLKRQIDNLKRHIADYCPAAPAAPSEQAEPSAPSIRDSVDYHDFHEDLLRLSEPGLSRKQAKVIRASIVNTIDARVRNCSKRAVAAAAAAPAAPLPAQPSEFGQKVTALIAEIIKAKSPAWRDSKVEELIELIEPSAFQPQQSGSIRPSAEPAGQQDASFSDSILHAIYKACQRGDSPERMHAAVMALVGKPEQSAFLRAAMDFAQAHINCDEIESAYESNPESGSEADTAEVDAMYNITKKRLVEAYRALNSDASLAGAAPLPELTGPSTPMIQALTAARNFIESRAEECGYGYARPANPHDFHPDADSCSEEEIAAHKAACEAFDKGEYVPEGGHQCTPGAHILVAPWGIGSYTFRDEQSVAIIEEIDQALADSPSTAPAQPTLCSDVQYLRNVVEDVKLALRNTDRQPLEVLLEGATAALEKSNAPPLVAAPVGQQDETVSAITDTASARRYVDEWHRKHFPADRTFQRYIMADPARSNPLAGDFAWQLAKALEQLEVSRCRAQGGDTKTSDACWLTGSPASRMRGIASKESAEPSPSFVAVDAYDANDGVDGQHPSYGRGVFFTLNCMKTLYESAETAAPGAPAERTCYEDNDGATRCISCHANHDQNQDHGEDCWVDRAEKGAVAESERAGASAKDKQ